MAGPLIDPSAPALRTAASVVRWSRPLVGRRVERARLDAFVAGVRSGQSQVLVLRGEAGIGKSALLEQVATQAEGCRVLAGAGVQADMELPFAALHQVLGPLLGGVDRLPPPQRDAVKVAFGLLAATPPDRFMVALAVLTLLSDAASEGPIVCLIDDEQWLDQASVHALAFVARRLDAEAVGIVFAGRRPDPLLAKLPELVIEGLDEGEARLLLESSLVGPLDPLVREQLLAETHGNPLALLELPRGCRQPTWRVASPSPA
jgi:predicted ATPase